MIVCKFAQGSSPLEENCCRERSKETKKTQVSFLNALLELFAIAFVLKEIFVFAYGFHHEIYAVLRGYKGGILLHWNLLIHDLRILWVLLIHLSLLMRLLKLLLHLILTLVIWDLLIIGLEKVRLSVLRLRKILKLLVVLLLCIYRLLINWIARNSWGSRIINLSFLSIRLLVFCHFVIFRERFLATNTFRL